MANELFSVDLLAEGAILKRLHMHKGKNHKKILPGKTHANPRSPVRRTGNLIHIVLPTGFELGVLEVEGEIDTTYGSLVG